MRENFWERFPLRELADDEWEALCDGCGRCCLVRFANEDGGGFFYTLACCKLLDPGTCRCSDYAGRFAKVPDCLSIRGLEPKQYAWLPPTCAYRVLQEGGELAWWHPLISGRTETVAEAGVGVQGRVFSEEHIHPEELETLVLWDD